MRSLTLAQFDEALSFSIQEKRPMLVDFWGTWCAPCRALKPLLEDLEKDYKEVDFYTVDVFLQSQLASRWMVESVPKILILVNGLVLHVLGVCSREELSACLDAALDTSKEN